LIKFLIQTLNKVLNSVTVVSWTRKQSRPRHWFYDSDMFGSSLSV